MDARRTQPSDAYPGCHASAGGTPPIVSSPHTGTVVWPSTPIAAHPTHDAIVKPTTQGRRRARASEIAPSTCTLSTTSTDAMPFATAYSVLDFLMNATGTTEKYSVATFIE